MTPPAHQSTRGHPHKNLPATPAACHVRSKARDHDCRHHHATRLSLPTFHQKTLRQHSKHHAIRPDASLIHHGRTAYAEKTVTYAEKTVTYAEKTVTYAEKTVTYAEKTVTYAEKTVTYAEKTVTYAEKTVTYAEVNDVYAKTTDAYA